MFLKLNHQQLDVYDVSLKFALACYRLTKSFPSEEKFALTSQIRRAALSVHLNIAEGSSRRSELERKRYFEISRGSVIEIDAALDIANLIGYLENINVEETTRLGVLTVKCFKLLSGLINAKTGN